MSRIEVEKMNTVERLQAMEELWEALSRDEAEVRSPEWHGKVLDARRRRIESGEAKVYTLDQLKNCFGL